MNGKRKVIVSASMLLIVLVSGLTGYYVGRNQAKPKLSQADIDAMNSIYPSIYITGSSGNISSIDPIVQGVVADKETKAKRGLDIVVKTDNSLEVTGQINRNNHYPTIEVGMAKGTNNSLKYEAALKSVMTYLGENYSIPYHFTVL